MAETSFVPAMLLTLDALIDLGPRLAQSKDEDPPRPIRGGLSVHIFDLPLPLIHDRLRVYDVP